MHILFVVAHFPSVSETFVLNQITNLIELGHDVSIFPLATPDDARVHPDVARYSLMDKVWSKGEMPRSWVRRALGALVLLATYPAHALRLLKTVNGFRYGRMGANLTLLYRGVEFIKNKGKFDIVHCHFGVNGACAVAWREVGLLDQPITIVFHAHDIAMFPDNVGRHYYKPTFQSSAKLLPISRFWEHKLISWGADPQRIRVHRMGVDTAFFAYQGREIDRSQPARIVTVCRLVDQKGLEYALEAIRILRDRNANICFTIAGGGPLFESLRQLAAELGINECVEFIGPQSQDKVQTLLAEAHIFLAPSVTAPDGLMEGIPVAMMEAMAVGLPVVSTRHSGIPELIDDGVSGVLADERDAETLAKGIARLIDDPVFYQRVAWAGREKVEKHFNIKKLALELEAIFSEEIGAGQCADAQKKSRASRVGEGAIGRAI